MPISSSILSPAIASLSLVLTALFASPAAWSQLPPAPTPVPGSLLERSGPARGLPDGAATRSDGERGSSVLPDTRAATRQIAFGTAFRVSEAGHLLTSRHVVEGCRAIGIVVGDKAIAGLRVLAADPHHDLALLSGPPGPRAASLRANDELFQGEDALSYGFPLPGMLSEGGQLGAGMVTALSGLRNDPAQMQVDVPLQSGNSGGPLLDRRGPVIGMLLAKLDALRVAQVTGDLPQNVSFAVRLAPVRRLLETQGVDYEVGAPDAPAQTNQQIAAEAREWTLPIACQRNPIRR